MDLKWLKYFHEVVKTCSFTQASRNLKISQPAVSKMVSLFEAELGARLFYRDGKSVLLTEMGRAFFKRTSRIFEEQENLEKLRNFYLKECVGDLSIGSSDNLLSYILPPLVHRYLLSRPHVNLKLFSGASPQLKVELIEKRIEMALFFTPLTADEKKTLSVEMLTTVEFYLVIKAGLLSPNKIAQGFSTQSFNQLNLRYIGSRTSDYSANNPALKLHYEILGITPRSYIQVNNHEVIKKLCHEGLGYTVIPNYMVRAELKSGTLVRIKTPQPMVSKVYLVRRKTSVLSRPGREFVQELKKALMKSPN